MNTIRVAMLLLTVHWLAPVQAGLLDVGYQSRYAVSRSGLPLGESVRALRPLGDGLWQFDAHTEPTGLAAVLFGDVIDERSQLRLDTQGVSPLNYRYNRHGGRKEQAYTLRFDWPAQQLHFEHSGQQLPLQPDTQDPMSFVLAVMLKLQHGEQPFKLAIAGRNKVRDYQVRIDGSAEMDTPLGRQRVVRILAEEIGKDTRYDLWCLPKHDYLPMRIRQERNKETTELRLRELITPAPATLTSP